jgi:two-component system, sensor histidine kinase and response regulator
MHKILVVDDERFLREDISDVLALEGFEVYTAANGREGIELARLHQPDLVICDIAMPELDGYQVLLEMRKDPAMNATPFIFVTARTDRSNVRQGMEMGADDYITKPFTNKELITAIRARLSRQESVRVANEHDLDTAKQQLAQMVAHELRTPLMSVSTVQQLLETNLDTFSTAELQDLVGIMRSGTQRLNHLVEQMVFLVRVQTRLISADTVTAAATITPSWSLLMSAVNAARQFARRNPNGQIRLMEQDRDVQVAAHIQALTHALAEILTNALDFSGGDNEVRIQQWAEDGRIYLKIVDQGQGIPSDRIAQAFEPFQQIDRDRHEQQGMGIGLYLANAIIHAHDGTLDIESEIGFGTTVYISLPAVN